MNINQILKAIEDEDEVYIGFENDDGVTHLSVKLTGIHFNDGQYYARAVGGSTYPIEDIEKKINDAIDIKKAKRIAFYEAKLALLQGDD